MSYQCVQIAVISGTGQEVIVPASDCSAGLMLVDPAAAIALAQNPLLIPPDAVFPIVLALLGLFIAAWVPRMATKALD